MFQLVETIKVLNGNIYNLRHHQWRLEYSFEVYFKKKPFFLLQNAIVIPEEFSKGLFKLLLSQLIGTYTLFIISVYS